MSIRSTRGFACLSFLGICLVLVIWLPLSTVIGSERACGEDSTDESITGVFVEPDDGYRPIVDELNAATCEIFLNIYLISDDVIVDALVAAYARGVDVRVLIEEHPFGGSSEGTAETLAHLDNAGIPWRFTPDRFRFSHAKYAVVDRNVGIVMNLNLTPSAFAANREFGSITTQMSTVDTLHDVFLADWNDDASEVDTTGLVLSPDNARVAIRAEIDQARASIDMYAEVIRDDEIVDALIEASRRGVRVRVIVNLSIDDLDYSIYTRLDAGGVDIVASNHLYIHAKAMIFDNDRVLIGSHNPTSTSLDENREVSLLVDDMDGVARVVRTFAMDLARSAPVFADAGARHSVLTFA